MDKTLKDKYYFDYVFDENTDQNTMFSKTAYPLVKTFFDGQSCLLFAYGITNAGKTFTILGDPKNPGIIPKTLSYCFNLLEKKDSTHVLKVTYVEVYNDNVYDLLNIEKREKLALVEQNGLIVVKGASLMDIKTIKDAGDVLTMGSRNRSIATTSLNHDSSRSHAVFTIQLHSTTKGFISQMSIVDLAGSERAVRTNAQGERLKEAIGINQSLTTLGRCLNILRQNQMKGAQPQVVPFRDSKLTRMFQDLITNGRVVMIVNVSPSEMDLEENVYVLKYAAVASKIETGSKFLKSNSMIKNQRETISTLDPMDSTTRQQVSLESQIILKQMETNFAKYMEEMMALTNLKYEKKLTLLEQDVHLDFEKLEELDQSQKRITELELELDIGKKHYDLIVSEFKFKEEQWKTEQLTWQKYVGDMEESYQNNLESINQQFLNTKKKLSESIDEVAKLRRELNDVPVQPINTMDKIKNLFKKKDDDKKRKKQEEEEEDPSEDDTIDEDVHVVDENVNRNGPFSPIKTRLRAKRVDKVVEEVKSTTIKSRKGRKRTKS